MSTYYQDDDVTLIHGDALEQVAKLGAGTINCIVTSPPYYGLRDYGAEGQYGLEETPAAYVETLRALFSECRRVLADDGTLWLNIGDSYSSGGSGSTSTKSTLSGNGHHGGGPKTKALPGVKRPKTMPSKNLLGIPWRTAFALQDDGWILRNAIIWHKPNAMPESVTDRLSGRHENIFMFTKSQRYWFDLDPIRETTTSTEDRAGKNALRGQKAMRPAGPNSGRYNPNGKNPGDVWEIATRPFPGAHFATMPPELARRAILAGCKTGGTVLDPFSGSGTTGLVAQNNSRKYVGIDISVEYLKLSLDTRLQNHVLDFTTDAPHKP